MLKQPKEERKMDKREDEGRKKALKKIEEEDGGKVNKGTA